MSDFDFEEIEDSLELVVPNIYQMFIEAVDANGYDLKEFNICHDSASLIQSNEKLRIALKGSTPPWKSEYMYFGVGDGCGNHFFLVATDEDDDEVKLWAHDPAGIEEVSTAAEFFKSLLSELEQNFEGPEKSRFQGFML